MTPPARLAAAVVIVAVIATSPACSLTSPGGEAPVKIAFFQDLSVPDHVDLVSPSFLALDMVVRRRLADRGVEAEVVQFDTGGDAGRAVEMAESVAADEAFVLAVAAPFWHEPARVSSILATAGVPTISLSPVSASPWGADRPPAGDATDLWRRFVPDRAAEAELLASIAARRSSEGVPQPVCLVRDGSPYGLGLAGQMEDQLEGWPATSIDGADPDAAAAAIASAGCKVVVWAGFAPGARELARAMRAAGSARGRPGGPRRRRREDDDPADVAGGRRRGRGLGRVPVRGRGYRPRAREPQVRERLPVRARTHAGGVRRRGVGCRPSRGRRDRRRRGGSRVDARRHVARSWSSTASRGPIGSTRRASSSGPIPGCSSPPEPAGCRSRPDPRSNPRIPGLRSSHGALRFPRCPGSRRVL